MFMFLVGVLKLNKMERIFCLRNISMLQNIAKLQRIQHVTLSVHAVKPNATHSFEKTSVKLQTKCPNCLQFYGKQNYSTDTSVKMDNSPSIAEKLKRVVYKLGVTLPSKYKLGELEGAAYVLLNSVYMKVQHSKLRENAGLEDSFNMWLQIVYVHIWALIIRLKQEGRDGEIVINIMIKLLWCDIEKRLNHLQEELKENLDVGKRLKQYYSAINLIFSYLDEGILSSDAHLASALWQIVYDTNSYNVEAWHLEALVNYTRFLILHVDNLDMDVLVKDPSAVEWPVPAEFE